MGVMLCFDLTRFSLSLLSLSCSVNSRNSGDSVGLRNKPCETTFSGLSTAKRALTL